MENELVDKLVEYRELRQTNPPNCQCRRCIELRKYLFEHGLWQHVYQSTDPEAKKDK